MDKKKVDEIIKLVHKRSISGKLKWEEISEKQFQLNYPKSSINIGMYLDTDAGVYYYSLQFLNSEGVIVLSIHDDNIKDYYSGTYKDIEEIYNSAKASVLKADETLDDIFKSLRDEIPF